MDMDNLAQVLSKFGYEVGWQEVLLYMALGWWFHYQLDCKGTRWSLVDSVLMWPYALFSEYWRGK